MAKLICSSCKREFERERDTSNRRRYFCSRACRSALDELSQFRFHLKSIKCHAKKINKRVDLSLEDLRDKWNEQGGICPFTKWRLINQPSANWRKLLPLTPDRGSVDRVDSNEHYTKDNIRFVSVMIQWAKNSFTDAQLHQFCKAIRENYDLNSL